MPLCVMVSWDGRGMKIYEIPNEGGRGVFTVVRGPRRSTKIIDLAVDPLGGLKIHGIAALRPLEKQQLRRWPYNLETHPASCSETHTRVNDIANFEERKRMRLGHA
ncbi:hypothetical protein KM043_017742 [Ampulex compressa]|nr:hypothetical protein KM043_017742 [Ampulex compressa]